MNTIPDVEPDLSVLSDFQRLVLSAYSTRTREFLKRQEYQNRDVFEEDTAKVSSFLGRGARRVGRYIGEHYFRMKSEVDLSRKVDQILVNEAVHNALCPLLNEAAIDATATELVIRTIKIVTENIPTLPVFAELDRPADSLLFGLIVFKLIWLGPQAYCEAHPAPDDVDSYRYHIDRGQNLQEEGDMKASVFSYTRAICVSPEEGFAYLGRGYAFRELGALDWAIQDLDSAIEIDPFDHESWATRATCYEELGEHERAKINLDKAIELDGSNSDYYCYRGYVDWSLGLFSEALVDLARAIEIDPDNPEAYSVRSQIHRDLGDIVKADEDVTHSERLSR